MAISLLTNLASLNTRRHLEETGGDYAQAMERIASGKRINRSGDDAAGLSISFSLESKIRSIQQAQRNANDALSLFQVAEGGMNEVGNLVVRLRELAIQAASDNVGDNERSMLDLEANQIKEEVERLAQSTRYFNTPLLNGKGKDFVFQIGIENDENNRLQFSASTLDLTASKLGIDGVSFGDKDEALDSLSTIDTALQKMNLPRAQVGALQSRMHAITGNLNTYEEAMTSAKSRIVDADLARETSNAIRSQVLQKAGVAVLTQANMIPALALKLIEG